MAVEHGDSTLQNLDAWASAAQSIVTALALVAGGLFTYFKFFKDRVYRQRTDMAVDPVIFSTGTAQTLVCRLTVKNIGTSKIRIVEEGTALMITPGDIGPDPFDEPSWGELIVYEVFPGHDWIESGETILDDVSIALPQPRNIALRIELRIVSRRWRPSNLEVSCRAILPPGEPSKEAHSEALQKKGDDETVI